MAITDRARENREHVRTLLKENQPEFAALLEWLERELACLRCSDTFAGHGRKIDVSAAQVLGSRRGPRAWNRRRTERPGLSEQKAS